jgi:hypothetical protein
MSFRGVTGNVLTTDILYVRKDCHAEVSFVPTEIKTTGQRKPAARRRSAELKRLSTEVASLKSDVAVLNRELEQVKAAASRGTRPELEAIGVLKDSPLWKLEAEALAEMRQAAKEEYDDDPVEVSAR